MPTDSLCVALAQTRYTAVRRQTAPAKGARETQVLDYQNVASDLLPTVAAAYALKFMGQVPSWPPEPDARISVACWC